MYIKKRLIDQQYASNLTHAPFGIYALSRAKFRKRELAAACNSVGCILIWEVPVLVVEMCMGVP